MQLNGRFNHVSKSGHALDVVKSAIQKYARRGDALNMFKALTEMDAFSECEIVTQTDTSKIKAIRTNMINRLKIILFEDVSFSQLDLFADVVEKIKKWESGDRTDRKLLYEICVQLATAKKSRMPSYLKNTYANTLNDTDVTKTKFENACLLKHKPCEYDNNFSFLYSEDESTVKELLTRYVQTSRFNYLAPLVEFSLKEWTRMKPSVRKGDRLLFLIVPFLWIWHKIKFTMKPIVVTLRDAVDNDVTDELITEIYADTNVKFDDYVYDIHTKEGKKEV